MASSTHIHGRPRTFGPYEFVSSAANGEPVVVSAAAAPVGAALVRTDTGFAFAPSTPLALGLPATSIGTGTVDNTEFGYLDGVTSSVQTQFNTQQTQINSKITFPSFEIAGDVLSVSGANTVAANYTRVRLASGFAIPGGGQFNAIIGSFNATTGGDNSITMGCNNASNNGAQTSIISSGNATAVNGTYNSLIACNRAVITGSSTSCFIAGCTGVGTACASINNGSASFAIGCAGTTVVSHNNAGCIGGTSLTSQANNSLTSNAVYANTTLLTCDPAQKKSITDSNVGEGTDAFTAKLMAVKPKMYRWKTEDDAAPLSKGFDADEIAAAFPECVRRTWRKESIVFADEKNVWKDDNGVEYSESIVDKSRIAEYTFADPNWGFVYTNEPLSHAVIDTTAMLSMLLQAVRHLQLQVTQLNTLKSDVALLKANVTIRL